MECVLPKPNIDLVYQTSYGSMYCGEAEKILLSDDLKPFHKNVQLIFTSPPFPLNRKKKYGNYQGEEFIDWLAKFAPLFKNYLKSNGSIVMEMGNAWVPGKPVMSPLALRALLKFLEEGDFHLCQQFIAYNPARLPSPAQWVNVDRIRVKDSFTHIWWMSPSDKPHADNRQVLKKYSKAMQQLLSNKKYNAGKRPSEHKISQDAFFRDNDGAIPSNVITVANTNSSDDYLRYCRLHDLQPHPARMPVLLPEFFIKFLTTPGSIVLDPFAGSNTTGSTAEKLERRWVSIEVNKTYVESSKGRFVNFVKMGDEFNDNHGILPGNTGSD